MGKQSSDGRWRSLPGWLALLVALIALAVSLWPDRRGHLNMDQVSTGGVYWWSAGHPVMAWQALDSGNVMVVLQGRRNSLAACLRIHDLDDPHGPTFSVSTGSRPGSPGREVSVRLDRLMDSLQALAGPPARERSAAGHP